MDTVKNSGGLKTAVAAFTAWLGLFSLGPASAQDQLSRIVTPGVTLRAFGYDPTTDAIFLATNSSDQIIKVSDVSSGNPTSQTMIYITSMQKFYINNNLNLIGDASGTLNGMLLNPLPIGDTPAYSFAVCTDSGARVYESTSGTRTYYDNVTKRLYNYDLGPADPSGDASDALTSRVTLADLQAAAGSTDSSTSIGRQMAWSGDGQSVYFTDSSSGSLGGLWKVGALSGSPQRLLPVNMQNAEPGVFSAGGVDRIYFSGISGTTGVGNAGGIDFVTHDGITTSGPQVAVSTAKLADFFEVSGTMSSQRISSIAFAGSDMYFSFYNNNGASNPLARFQGIFRLDAEGRLSKVANRTERAAAFGGLNLIWGDRFQPREITYTGTAGSFPLTQILYRDGLSGNIVAGVIAFKPGDFNRDNSVTSADIDLFKPQVTSGSAANVKTNVADLKFDMNGNDIVDWKDVQILEQFLDYVPDPTLAGRAIPTLPIQADADLNGLVDFADFRIMRDNYEPTAGDRTFLVGDFNGDDKVDGADLQPWINSDGYRSAVVGIGVPATPFDQAEFDAFLATLPPPNVVLDVASGTSTQFQQGYRSIVIAASVTKTGSGSVIFDAVNTYSGTTAINAGTLRVGTGTFGSLNPSSAITGSAGAALAFGRSDVITQGTHFNATIGGAINVAQVGSGTVIFNGVNTYTGTTRVEAGTLAVANTAALAGSTLDMNAADSGSVVFALSGTRTYTLGGLSGARSLPIGGNSLVVGANGQSTEYAGVFSGSGGALTKTGGGSLTLASSFSSGTGAPDTTRVEAGALVWSARSAQTGTTTVSGTAAFGLRVGMPFTAADLDAVFGNTFSNVFMSPGASVAVDVNGSGSSFTYSTTLPAGRGLLKLGEGTLVLDGTSPGYDGTTTIRTGTLQVGSAQALGASGELRFEGGALQFSTANVTDYSGRFSNGTNQQYRIDTAGLSVSFASPLTSPGGSLAKFGAGTLTLTGSNTYSGGTRVEAGTLRGSAASLQGAIANNAAVVFDQAASGTYAGGMSGTGALTKLGAGTLALTGSNEFTGITRVESGALVLANTAALAGSTLDMNGADSGSVAFALAGTTYTLGGLQGSRDLTVAGNSLIVGLNGATTTYSGRVIVSGTGSFTKLGAGTLTLAGSSAISGGTQINAGTLAVGSSGALGSTGTISFGGGALQFSSGNVTDYSGRFATGTNQRYRIDTGGQSVTFASPLVSAGGSLAKLGAGTLTLTASNAFSGGIQIDGGTLALGSAGALGSTGTISFGGGTLQFSDSNVADYSERFPSGDDQQYRIDTAGQSVVFASNLRSDGGSLTKLGDGTLTLSATNTYSGTTVIAAGSLIVDPKGSFNRSPLVDVRAGATLDVSRVAAGLTVANGQTLGGSGTVDGSVIFGRGSTLSPGSVSGINSLASLAALPVAEPLQLTVSVVPEPASGALAVMAALTGAGIGIVMRRRSL